MIEALKCLFERLGNRFLDIGGIGAGQDHRRHRQRKREMWIDRAGDADKCRQPEHRQQQENDQCRLPAPNGNCGKIHLVARKGVIAMPSLRRSSRDVATHSPLWSPPVT